MKKSVALEIITLTTGVLLFAIPMLNISSILSSSSISNGAKKYHIQVDYSECESPSEPMLRLSRASHGNNIQVDLDFINYGKNKLACDKLVIETKSKVTQVVHSKIIDGVRHSDLFPMDGKAVKWHSEDRFSSIFITKESAPNFSGRLSFIAIDSITRNKIGYQLISSFGVSGKSEELPFYKFVQVSIGANEKIDFTVPQIHAINVNNSSTELTFSVGSGMETDIFTDVLVSVIDSNAIANREVKISWLSALLGTGIGLIIGAVLALTRDYASNKLDRIQKKV